MMLARSAHGSNVFPEALFPDGADVVGHVRVVLEQVEPQCAGSIERGPMHAHCQSTSPVSCCRTHSTLPGLKSP